MLFKSLLIVSVLTLYSFSIEAQVKKINLDFIPVYNNYLPKMNENVLLHNSKKNVAISKLKFYISNVRMLQSKKEIFREEGVCHLLDWEQKMNLEFQTPDVEFDEIDFNVGVDSVINNAGAIEGDLDPSNGMYWTWQSGFINVKLEGEYKNKENIGKSFEFHIGGYRQPFSTLQLVHLKLDSDLNRSQLHVKMDLQKFFNGIDFETVNHIMSPSENAVKISSQFASIFFIAN
jgi:hypothetical protein